MRNPNPEARASSLEPRTLFASLYLPPTRSDQACDPAVLIAIAQAFTPRYERNSDRQVTLDISGLGRLLGPPRAIGEELRRDAAARGARVHIAIAGAHTAARVLALAVPGMTIVDRGEDGAAVALLPIDILDRVEVRVEVFRGPISPAARSKTRLVPDVSVFKEWGLKTLGEVAALPDAELSARVGSAAALWQSVARGRDMRPLVPEAPEERFEASLELEWPIEELEPLSFVLTRLFEPLSTRLERRDRGAAALYVELGLVSSGSTLRQGSGQADVHTRMLQLPTPIRDMRTLRTLAMLDIESHPPVAPVERVAVVIEPTPGRVLQHTLFTRARAMPEQLSTLLARLAALVGQDRIGSPAVVDSHRPGAFEMSAFSIDDTAVSASAALNVGSGRDVVSAVRRCRRPVPARVTVVGGRPVRVTSDRQGFGGGAVLSCAGPWRTSGEWWGLTTAWSRDEWDVALGDGAVYRIFQDRVTDRWFIDGIVD